jgi:hypothetical protein
MAEENIVLGWSLDRDERRALLERFAPTYPDPVADHVTLQSHVAADTPPPPPVTCRIVGRADDGAGVEAMVVEIDGSTDRPDGSTFHITWSLDRRKGRGAIESNDVIRERGWTSLDEPVDVSVIPARFSSG